MANKIIELYDDKTWKEVLPTPPVSTNPILSLPNPVIIGNYILEIIEEDLNRPVIQINKIK